VLRNKCRESKRKVPSPLPKASAQQSEARGRQKVDAEHSKLVHTSAMFPRFWNLIDDQWLTGRTASKLFTVAAIFTVVVPTLIYLDIAQGPGVLSQVFWGIAGVLTAFSMVFLWSGMWRFWSKLDQSSRYARRIWFFVLLFGLWYGAVLYFIFVYLRPSSRRLLVESEVNTP
jgi:hypothetical protein